MLILSVIPSPARFAPAAIWMMRSNHFFSVAVCLGALLVESRAACDEAKRAGGAREPSTGAHYRREPVGRRGAPRPAAIAFGLRLPSFLSVGSWSASGLGPRSISHGPRPTECRSHCAAGEVTDRTRATVSTILAGVGALGVTTGVVFSIASPRRSERSSLAPSFRLKLSGQRAIASADWKF
jgi:hypothetical protein